MRRSHIGWRKLELSEKTTDSQPRCQREVCRSRETNPRHPILTTMVTGALATAPPAAPMGDGILHADLEHRGHRHNNTQAPTLRYYSDCSVVSDTKTRGQFFKTVCSIKPWRVLGILISQLFIKMNLCSGLQTMQSNFPRAAISHEYSPIIFSFRAMNCPLFFSRFILVCLRRHIPFPYPTAQHTHTQIPILH